jgi:thioredoxin reductase
VGGGDSAMEAALLLSESRNIVTVSYRGDAFSRIKPKNLEKINTASRLNKIKVLFNTNVKEIKNDIVILKDNIKKSEFQVKNDLVYIFAGGELPTEFLKRAGVNITKKFGDAILKH